MESVAYPLEKSIVYGDGESSNLLVRYTPPSSVDIEMTATGPGYHSGFAPRRVVQALSPDHPLSIAYGKGSRMCDTISTPNENILGFRDQIRQSLADDRWSMIGVFSVENTLEKSAPEGNQGGQATLIVAVYPGAINIERAKEILWNCWLVSEE